ncbi:5-oxoprolinase subunit PxpA [Marinimicrobium sp. ABcell2]|uniref:5-oxoprolinase subunit PxpA n=1 Tax=Marinimicrobium sp. ABcell2 TaxID=3069751 RepID=UPI0027ADB6FC|nr:5-oxoprolinase subunit PxpA [Marinimicrobium sp. ABcell2]MDQ2076010.1 5-oxoprolinase subunit PxpA [Marinimicrobium sp. ABcell2]
MNTKRLLLNCDMGESFGPWQMGMDEHAMPLVDMANIACGFHASDPLTMTRTVLLANQHQTRIGAHPSYPDLAGFGRRSLQCTPKEITAMVQYQVGALNGICRARGVDVSYVKPHGALYNDMMRDDSILRAVLTALAHDSKPLPLMLLARADNEKTQRLADEFKVPLLFEAFADRAYDEQGFLVARNLEGAVYQDPEKIMAQSLLLAKEGLIETVNGHRLQLAVDTLCVHGDNAESVQVLQRLRTALDQLYASQSPTA